MPGLGDVPQGLGAQSVGGLGGEDFAAWYLAKHRKSKQADRAKQRALDAMPNPKGQYLTNPTPTRQGTLSDMLRSGLERLGLSGRKAAGVGDFAASLTSAGALDDLDRGDPTTALENLVGGPAQAMFLGIGAKTADKAALKLAEAMAAKGETREAIHKATGWFKGADDKWRFEIDDSAAKFRPRAEQGFKDAAVGDVAFTHNTDGMMSHIPLHQAYDDLWKVDTKLTKGGGYPYQPSARYQVRESGKEEIHLNAGNLDQAKALNLHELQHAIQRREGFARGADAVDESLAPYRDEIMAEAKALHAKGMPLGDALVMVERKKRLELYNRSAGEVEAGNVEKRMNMTAAQRRETPPTSITDIYTATNPNGTTVVAITLANETAGAVIVKIDRYDGATNWNTWRKSVAANSTEILSDFPMKLRSGHKIKATADGANAITVNVDVVLDGAASKSG